jgi:hypothetical protein
VAHPSDPDRSVDVLPGGETLALDGSTIADPETGQPVPAAVLRLPTWRLQELAAALHIWNRMQTLFTTEGAHLPMETALADRVTVAAESISGRHDQQL